MTITEAAQKMRELSVTTSPAFTKFVQVKIAQDLMVMVKERWDKRGVTYDGRMLSYSTKPCLMGYSQYPLNKKAFPVLLSQTKKYNKKAAKSGDAKMGGWVTVMGKNGKYRKLIVVDGGYKAIRNAGGYQITHVDFDIVGTMWKSVKVKPAQVKGNIIEVIFGPTDIESAIKIAGHNKHFNTNILMPNSQELQISSELIESYVIAEIKKRFGG